MTSDNLVLALSSGLLGAIVAQLLAIWHGRKLENERTALTRQLETERQHLAHRLETERQAFEIHGMKLDVLRKIAGSRAAITNKPFKDHLPRFFEGLNEVMVVFSDSKGVSSALIGYKAAIGTNNHNDRLIDLFKAACHDVGIDPTAFNDSLFLDPFIPTNI
jgi:hypothetical protein